MSILNNLCGPKAESWIEVLFVLEIRRKGGWFSFVEVTSGHLPKWKWSRCTANNSPFENSFVQKRSILINRERKNNAPSCDVRSDTGQSTKDLLEELCLKKCFVLHIFSILPFSFRSLPNYLDGLILASKEEVFTWKSRENYNRGIYKIVKISHKVQEINGG